MTSLLSHFLNDWLLWGMLGALVPLAIHLLHRSRYRVEPWGAMMFLQQSIKARAKTVKLQQIVMLILRALFFILLAVALARPLLNPTENEYETSGGETRQQPPTTHVLIIDSSYSLQFGNHETNIFDKVRESAISIVTKMEVNDNMLLIRAGSRARPVFRNPTSDRDLLQRRIEAMAPGNEKADLLAAVLQAYRMVAETTRPKVRIYILTDRQKGNWPEADDSRWTEMKRLREIVKAKSQIYILPHQVKMARQNLQVQRVYSSFPIVDVHRQNHFVVEIRNDGEPRKTRVDFFANDRLEGEREIELKPGVNSVGFDCSFNTPGPHYVRASIPEDELNVDNSYTLALKVIRQIPVLLIEGNSSPDPFQSDGGYLDIALTSAATDQQNTLITVTRRGQTELDDIDSAFMSQFKSIVLVNVSSLSTYFRSRLESFVQQGGGLFVCLGPQVDMDNYNTMYKDDDGLLPAALTGVSEPQAPPLRPTFHSAAGENVLETFELVRTKVLENTRVGKYVFATPASTAGVLASFGDQPFLIHKPFGKGQVIMCTSTVDTTWTNMPLTEDYLPLMQNIVVYLSSNIKPPINLNLGETLLFAATLPEVRNLDLTIAQKAQVTTPTKKLVRMPLNYDDGQWVGQFDDTLTPGLYRVQTSNSVTFYAAHLDPSEGELTEMQDDQITGIAQLLEGSVVTSLADLTIQIERELNAFELWKPILFAALALLVVEMILGWKFS